MDLNEAINSYERLVRGDALIGLIPDVRTLRQQMVSALRAHAGQGSGEAYLYLGHCFAAGLKAHGAFDGVAPAEQDQALWSPASLHFRSGLIPAMQAAQRAYYEASLRGERAALPPLAMLSRMSGRTAITLVLEQLQALETPSPEERLLRGWVHNWLGDLPASFADITQAAEAGHPPAEFELSLYYSQGLGVPADPSAAQLWQDRAANHGNVRALYNRAAAFATGRGVPMDPTRAAADYQAAAEQGHAKAAATLAAMMLQGDVPGTPEDAGPWLDRAEAQGFDVFSLLFDLGIDDPR